MTNAAACRLRLPSSPHEERPPYRVPRPTTSRPSRRCSAPSSSTTRRTTGSRASWSPSISTSRCTSGSTRRGDADPLRQARDADHAQDLFRERRADRASSTVPQYLGRLAAKATTIINAEDYGRTIYDLATRRQLILIGEDMVNDAYDAPVDVPPRGADRGRRAAALRDRRDRQIRPGLRSPSPRALTDAIDMAANAYQRDGGLSGISSGFKDLDEQDGRPAALRPDHPGRPPGDGQDGARHQHRLQRRAEPTRREPQLRWPQGRRMARGRLLLAGNVGRAARHPHHLRAGRDPLRAHPPRQDRAETSSTAWSRSRSEIQTLPLYIDATGGITIGPARGAGAAAEAPARPGPGRGRLSAAADRLHPPRRRKAACRKCRRSPPG